MNNTRVSTFFHYCVLGIPVLFFLLVPSEAKLHEDLPGSEVTEEEYLNYITPQESIQKQVPVNSPESKTWLDNVSETWDAPPLAGQLAEDKNVLLIGMGAVFIPFMTNPELEPELEILDNTGKRHTSGKPGSKFNLVPGRYHIVLGSGSHQQKIVKTIFVTENVISPIVPVWSCLSIDVVDEDNQPFRGEYELARIDTFEVFGRGYGRNPELGEKVKTWVLKPGVYKIYGVGESYNTLTNFVTVRLLPGEYTRFILVEKDENDMTIIGGGNVQLNPGNEFKSKWKYRINAGGGIDFNYKYDRKEDTTEVDESDISIQFSFDLNYKSGIYEWYNKLQIDEGLTFFKISQFNLKQISSTIDEFRLSSIYTWRFLSRIGPYSRLAFETGIISQRVRKPVDDASPLYLMLLSKNLWINAIDSTSSEFLIQPPFSPIILESGVGVNVNILNTRYFDAKVLTGIGFTYENSRSTYRVGDSKDLDSIINGTINTHFKQCSTIVFSGDKNYSIIIDKESDRPNVGPEILFNFILRIGKYATIELKPEFFLPFNRFLKPDIDFRSLISWRIARMVTFDYDYKYALNQSVEKELQQHESRHRVLMRFSYSSKY